MLCHQATLSWWAFGPRILYPCIANAWRMDVKCSYRFKIWLAAQQQCSAKASYRALKQPLLQWASCQIRKIAGCEWTGIAGNVFSASDPDMHHGTCVTHVPWYMPGSLTSGLKSVAGKTFPSFSAHAQPAILRIWQEAYGFWCLDKCFFFRSFDPIDSIKLWNCESYIFIPIPFQIWTVIALLDILWMISLSLQTTTVAESFYSAFMIFPQ